MAKKDTNTTENTFKAKAKQYIKYAGKHIKESDEFEVKESDVDELSKYADIEMPKGTENSPATQPSVEEEKVGTEAGA